MKIIKLASISVLTIFLVGILTYIIYKLFFSPCVQVYESNADRNLANQVKRLIENYGKKSIADKKTIIVTLNKLDLKGIKKICSYPPYWDYREISGWQKSEKWYECTTFDENKFSILVHKANKIIPVSINRSIVDGKKQSHKCFNVSDKTKFVFNFQKKSLGNQEYEQVYLSILN